MQSKRHHLPGAGVRGQALCEAAASPADSLACHNNVQHTESKEVQEENDCSWRVGWPVKDGGFDQQKGHCGNC